MDFIDFLKLTGVVSLINAALGWWIKNSIDHKYAKALELFKTQNQLRLSALDERLRAHQEAYQLWREINTHLGTDKIQDVVVKCDKWWGEKCLYLEPEARDAFLKAWARAGILETMSPATRTEAHKSINDTGAVIERCVALPALNEFEITGKKA
jgi:hypothetical protein